MIASEDAAQDWLKSQAWWSSEASERLACLAAMLAEENHRQNLVSAASLQAVWQRHIADSAQLLCHVPRETGGPWLDLGTGAGFPGLVVAALCPDLEVLLAESRPRRCDWLERARLAMGLDHVEVIESQIERIEARHARVISARAFAPLPRLLDLSARFSTPETIWLLPKGRSAQQELDNLRGWAHLFHVEQSLTDPAAGLIVGTLSGKKGRTA
jgi:16S rRNA (guanine527-N7)-methyltransferase